MTPSGPLPRDPIAIQVSSLRFVREQDGKPERPEEPTGEIIQTKQPYSMRILGADQLWRCVRRGALPQKQMRSGPEPSAGDRCAICRHFCSARAPGYPVPDGGPGDGTYDGLRSVLLLR